MSKKAKVDTRDYLALYSAKCKRCGHLDPDEPKKYKCTKKNGNDQCPASEVQIVVVGKAIRFAQEVQLARLNRDAKKEGEIMKLVAEQNSAFRNKFYSELEAST
ncbi:hypothetical protein [Burkholderia phage BCSR5]|nr:hypothetical protein [Burkholderia phage BCSR5]